MAVTIRDIAQKLSLSPSTVSRSLQRDERVHPKTRAHVAEVAAKMGYQGRARRTTREVENPTASTPLRIAMLLRSEDSHSSPNAMRFLHGMTAEADGQLAYISLHALRAHDYDADPSPQALPDVVRHGECDVVVLEGRHDPAAVKVLAGQVPIVSCEWVYDGVPHDTVLADNIGGIRGMVDHLVQHGHRQLAWVGEAYAASFVDQRQAGFIQSCLHHNLPFDPQAMLGVEVFNKYKGLIVQPILDMVTAGVTGFVCVNDRVAKMVISVLRNAAIEVPAQVSVTGFDAMAESTGGQAPLTTVDPQFIELGRLALRLARYRASQPAAGYVNQTCLARLIVGNSTGPAQT